MWSEQVALGIAERCAPAPRAVVDGEDQVAAHGEHGSTGRDVAQTAGRGLTASGGDAGWLGAA